MTHQQSTIVITVPPAVTTATTAMPMKYTKNDNGEFVCPQCDTTTKNQNTMHYHMKRHMNDLKFECKHCDKVFLQKQSLTVHMRFKHADELKESTAFQCPFDCEFTSPVKGNCLIHIIRVHFQEELRDIMIQQPETKTVLCSGCDEEFKSNSAFIYHSKRCLHVEDTEKKLILKEFL
jgi:uncharacterized C2H2 Zn-finger protein